MARAADPASGGLGGDIVYGGQVRDPDGEHRDIWTYATFGAALRFDVTHGTIRVTFPTSTEVLATGYEIEAIVGTAMGDALHHHPFGRGRLGLAAWRGEGPDSAIRFSAADDARVIIADGEGGDMIWVGGFQIQGEARQTAAGSSSYTIGAFMLFDAHDGYFRLQAGNANIAFLHDFASGDFAITLVPFDPDPDPNPNPARAGQADARRRRPI